MFEHYLTPAQGRVAIGRPAPAATTSPCTSVPGVGCVLNEFSATGFQLAYDSPQNGGNTNNWGYTGKSTNIAIFAEGHIQNVLTDLVTAENQNVPPLPHVKVNVVYARIPSPDVAGQDEFDLDTSTGIAGNVKSLYSTSRRRLPIPIRPSNSIASRPTIRRRPVAPRSASARFSPNSTAR